MAKTREELAAIEAMDSARRGANADELIALAQAYYNAPDSYHVSRGITGEPSNRNRTYRVTADCWTNHYWHDEQNALKAKPTRTVGTDVTVTDSQGNVTTRAASSFRKQAIARKQRTHAQAVATERHRITAADLAPIGNVE